jgi:hypothetical protein
MTQPSDADLSAQEREAVSRLARTMPMDPREEERTVRRLHAEGLLGARRPLKQWSRVARAAVAVAAAVACFLAGRWSSRIANGGLSSSRSAVPAADGSPAKHTVLIRL